MKISDQLLTGPNATFNVTTKTASPWSAFRLAGPHRAQLKEKWAPSPRTRARRRGPSSRPPSAHAPTWEATALLALKRTSCRRGREAAAPRLHEAGLV